MANPVTSACCVVLATVVLACAQRHNQEIKATPRSLLTESSSLERLKPQRPGRSPQRDSHIQYERIGSDVIIRCGTMDRDAVVTWTVNGTDMDSSFLNGSSLVLRNVDLSHNGLYSCFEGPSWQRWHQTALKVGHPPKEPVLICRSNNYPTSFYCSWHLTSPTYIPNYFNITVMHDSKQLFCERDNFPKNRCHIKYSRLFSTLKYTVTVVVTNALGKSSTSISFDEFSIVKPDPPENVVAKPVHNNPRRLVVTWQTPSTWPDPESFPLKFFLRYRPLILDQWQHVELSDGTSHTITDAYAGKEYIIQVAARDYDIGTWSDWSVAAHATPWTEEPKYITTEAQKTETTTTITTTTTTTYTAPSTTKVCKPQSVVGSSAVQVPWLSVLLLGPLSIFLVW
ncbi:ciliary neurotrophic factor receptor subunit alpha isoform X2 [Bombina bombina]|uniref:ciliary neurotrophic factor receptor subunit alpha isoform X2 n=2 Tax=Bombina bombina TaxID=8345 RepID=UPI00235AF76A|nr:ciliary neurotrophic factor receptor subunit alpha isoform X2 [Bombina bombina]